MLSGIRVGAVALLCLFGAGVSAEVVVSSSNPSEADLTAQLELLLEAEREGIESVSPSRLNRLTRTPEVDEDGGVYSNAYLAALPVAQGNAEWACLAEALYFEARGESVRGIFAVGEVIMNRVDSPNFPDTVCGVVNQGTGGRFQCQFSYNCDGRAEVFNEPKAYEKVGKVAALMIGGFSRSLTNGATHYHTKAVSPSWSRVYPRTAVIGQHVFYRQEYKVARR